MYPAQSHRVSRQEEPILVALPKQDEENLVSPLMPPRLHWHFRCRLYVWLSQISYLLHRETAMGTDSADWIRAVADVQLI